MSRSVPSHPNESRTAPRDHALARELMRNWHKVWAPQYLPDNMCPDDDPEDSTPYHEAQIMNMGDVVNLILGSEWLRERDAEKFSEGFRECAEWWEIHHYQSVSDESNPYKKKESK
jgi:hypothetical protein